MSTTTVQADRAKAARIATAKKVIAREGRYFAAIAYGLDYFSLTSPGTWQREAKKVLPRRVKHTLENYLTAVIIETAVSGRKPRLDYQTDAQLSSGEDEAYSDFLFHSERCREDFTPVDYDQVLAFNRGITW